MTSRSPRFLMVADSKLVSHPNVSALLKAEVPFIAPVPATQVKDEVYAALDLQQAQVVDWVPQRDAGKQPAERPDNRSVRPTGRMILYHLGELALRVGSIADRPPVRITRGDQLHLLELLGVDVTQTRWPQT
ncbi:MULTISPECIES: hypothetical protein [unclassified Kitasatospora]|uniref:hypothetical protein n=1 Tax=unclassified Kitasatospora TaxID=2633591 RepID=UPI0033C88D0F